MLTHYICMTCGIQFKAAAKPPESCPICEDERQYVGWQGQQWTTLAEVQQNHHNSLRSLEPQLTGIVSHPTFAIGQQAYLIQTPNGNILWDCITLLDDTTIAAVQALGSISALVISHPHYYSAMIEWSKAFEVPIYLHAADQEWVMRSDPNIVFWEGETHHLAEDITLIRCGGHFAGGSVLHWAAGAEGQGVIFSADTLQVVADRRYLSFMYSYPNYIPLPVTAVQRIVDVLEPFQYERIYGAFVGLIVSQDAKNAVARSAERYIKAIEA